MPTTSKYTPGPWKFLPRGGLAAVEIGRTIWGVCWIPGTGDIVREPELEATARLIAAAPDLLSALKEMLDKGEGCAACGFGAPGCGCRYERARAAISKAEGES